MGISAGGGDRSAPKSDINVTPLVDVVLVMLIIFLVTTPIMMGRSPSKFRASWTPTKIRPRHPSRSRSWSRPTATS